MNVARYNWAEPTTYQTQAAGFQVHPLLVKITRNRKSGGKRAANGAVRILTDADFKKADSNPKPITENSNGTKKTIQLHKGGSVTLSVDLNIMELKGKDREFVFELIDKLDQYTEALPAD